MLFLLTVTRLLVPLLIFKRPWWGIFLSVLLDFSDWELFPSTTYRYELYQQWDKYLDLYQQFVFVGYAHIKWQSAVMKKAAYGLLGLRTVGVVLFELTSWRTVLFIFPNVFESFFIFIELYRSLTRQSLATISTYRIALTVGALTGLKLIQEYLLHIKQSLPWQWPSGQFMPGGDVGLAHLVNFWIWLSIFLGIHAAILWSIHRRRLFYRPAVSPNDLSLYILFQHFILFFSLEYDNRRTFGQSASAIS